ncbi:MAG: RNA polymerase sigma factor [Bacteroides sp.]
MEIHEFIQGAERLRNDLLRQAAHYLTDADDAEDAVQETLLRLWMARERIATPDKMRNMASVVCRNVALNMLRDATVRCAMDEAQTTSLQASPQEELEARETGLQLRRSIRALSPKQRALIRMRNVENLSYADIAKLMGTTESSVRGMICKARMELLKQMKGAVE